MIKGSSWIRRQFELWLMRKFMLRCGPAMIQRRGYWQFVDFYGGVFCLKPTNDPSLPLVITKESE